MTTTKNRKFRVSGNISCDDRIRSSKDLLNETLVIENAIKEAWDGIIRNKKECSIRGYCKYAIIFSGHGECIGRIYTPGHLRDKDAIYYDFRSGTYVFTIPINDKVEFFVTIEAKVYDAAHPRDKLARRMVVAAMRRLLTTLPKSDLNCRANLYELLKHVS